MIEFAENYREMYELSALPAVVSGSGDPVACRARIQLAGLEAISHGVCDQAVICVLRADFPECPPSGTDVEINGETWTVRELLGSADGTNIWQWALLAGRDPRVGGGR